MLFKLEDSFDAFDTEVSLVMCIEEGNTLQKQKAYGAFADIRALCQRWEQLFSRTIDTSDVSRVNQAAGKPVAVASETAQLVQAALSYCKKSGGIFDITAGSATRLWNFKEEHVPSEENLREAVSHIGWEKVHVFTENNTSYIGLDDPCAALDLGGIAKGWMADEIHCFLQQQGFQNYLINLGGNILAKGNNAQGNPWVIGLTNPIEESDETAYIRTTEASVVTSGTYLRCFSKNGKILHHILNPQTGYPVESDAVSATIVCNRSVDAEGFSTTALALGIEKGLAFCQQQPEIISAFFIDYQGSIHAIEQHK